MKKRMRISKALEEVWEWKDRCYKEAKGMKLSDYLRKVHTDVERLLNEMGYRKVIISEGVYRLERK